MLKSPFHELIHGNIIVKQEQNPVCLTSYKTIIIIINIHSPGVSSAAGACFPRCRVQLAHIDAPGCGRSSPAPPPLPPAASLTAAVATFDRYALLWRGSRYPVSGANLPSVQEDKCEPSSLAKLTSPPSPASSCAAFSRIYQTYTYYLVCELNKRARV